MPFDPLTLSPAIWLRADAIAGLSDGDPIGTWADSSGNGRDLLQSGDARPTLALGALNGLPVVRMDGVNDFMVNATGASFLTGVGMTAFVVSILRSHSGSFEGTYALLGVGQGSDYIAVTGALMGYGTPSNNVIMTYRAGGPIADTPIGRPIATPYILTSMFDGTITFNRGYWDGAVQTDSGNVSATYSGATFDTDRLFLGCRFDSSTPSYFTASDYAEVLLFDVGLGDTDVAAVESYLIGKWFTAPAASRPPGRRGSRPRRPRALTGGWAR